MTDRRAGGERRRQVERRELAVGVPAPGAPAPERRAALRRRSYRRGWINRRKASKPARAADRRGTRDK